MHLRRGQELGRGCGAPLCQSPPRSTRGPALIGAVLGGVGRADPETRAQPRGEVSAPVLPSTIKSERAFFPAAASTALSASPQGLPVTGEGLLLSQKEQRGEAPLTGSLVTEK